MNSSDDDREATPQEYAAAIQARRNALETYDEWLDAQSCIGRHDAPWVAEHVAPEVGQALLDAIAAQS